MCAALVVWRFVWVQSDCYSFSPYQRLSYQAPVVLQFDDLLHSYGLCGDLLHLVGAMALLAECSFFTLRLTSAC